MNAVLISDLHLEKGREDITEAFLRFCDEKLHGLDAFYILGDFFEVWIGDDYEDELITTVKSKLKDISSNIADCYFQHGNRDFLVGEAFARETGFKILGEQHEFSLDDKHYLLMHGDSLCTRDTEYMQARQLLRSEAFQSDVLSKTIEERMALAQQLRAASMDANSGKAMEIMDVTPEEVEKLMQEKKVDYLIHGHTHRPAVHSLSLPHNGNAQRIVMSDWENDIQYVEIDETGPSLKRFSKAVT